MKSVSFHLFLLISLTAIAMSTAMTIGVTYSTPAAMLGSVQLSPDRIAAKFVSMKIPAVRLLDSNPAMIRAFANTNVSLLLSVPNTLVPILASNRSLAMHWVHLHVLPFHRRTMISTISVGNDVISNSPDVSPLFLLRAMQNVHLSLADRRIYGISVSTTFSFFDIILPWSARFQPERRDAILQFLEKTNSSLLITLCPYNPFRSCSIPVGIEELPWNFRDDLTVGVQFRELFDMMVDVVLSSMAVTGHENLPVIVVETGWPRSGIDAREVFENLNSSFRDDLTAGVKFRELFDMMKDSVSEVYIYHELVEKGANRSWGPVDHNLTHKYSFKFPAGGIQDRAYQEYLELLLCVFCIYVFVIVFLDVWQYIQHQMEARRLGILLQDREQEEIDREREALDREREELDRKEEKLATIKELLLKAREALRVMEERMEFLSLTVDDPDTFVLGDDEIYASADADYIQTKDLLNRLLEEVGIGRIADGEINDDEIAAEWRKFQMTVAGLGGGNQL